MPDKPLTDADLDRRVEELPLADLVELASEQGYPELARYRPHGMRVSLARHVLRLRAVAEAARALVAAGGSLSAWTEEMGEAWERLREALDGKGGAG